jgi:hypothetical protein
MKKTSFPELFYLLFYFVKKIFILKVSDIIENIKTVVQVLYIYIYIRGLSLAVRL